MDYRPRSPQEGDLNGTWRVHPLDDELRRTGADHDLDDGSWRSLQVPGHWGQQPGMADVDGPIIHRRRFEHRAPIDDERLWLRFDGILSSAEVWLDGTYLGDTVGYFARHQMEITELAERDQEHVLAVEVACPPPGGDTNRTSLTGGLQAGPLAPPGNPGGIWRPVSVESTGPVAIRHARLLCSSADEERAELSIRLVLDATEAGEVRVHASVLGPDGAAAGGGAEHHLLASGENRIEWKVPIEDPQLWWPASLGAQPTYEVAVSVQTADGEPSDGRQWRTGLRRIEVDDFVWTINGERLFAKGIAYGPPSRFLASVEEGQYGDDVRAALGAGLDLLRVSAHVAPDALYHEADRAGLLIWQDLPLLGSYSSKIRPAIRALARATVDQLGHHPSIGLWCGHIEPGGRPLATSSTSRRRRKAQGLPLGATTSPTSIGRWIARQALPGWNRTVLDPVIGRELRSADPTRPVVARSGTLPGPEAPTASDAHLWIGWQVGRLEDLPEIWRIWPRLATFPGGIGSQSAAIAPEVDDERADGGPENGDGRPGGPTWATAERAAFDRCLPRQAYPSAETWGAATRSYQADLLRFHIETLRRLKYRPTGGFVLTALADPEPSGGFGLLDVQRRPKPAYEVVVDACRPVVVIADAPPQVVAPGHPVELEIHVSSDLRVPLTGVTVTARAHWEHGDRGANDWSRRTTWEGDVDADACVRIGRFHFDAPEGHGPLLIDLDLVSDQSIVTNRYRTVVIPTSEAIAPPPGRPDRAR